MRGKRALDITSGDSSIRLDWRPTLTDFSTKIEKRPIGSGELEELIIDAIDERSLREERERGVARVRLLWEARRLFLRAALTGAVLAVLFTLIVPKRYESTARLMPPDQSSSMGSMLSAMSSRVGDGLASAAQSTLGAELKTTGDLFMGILRSDSVENDVIRKFDLQKLYHAPYIEDARDGLARHTDISQDQKSGIIKIVVTDHSPQRASAMAQEYVDKLNWVVTYMSTSSAHRERVFLDQRLQEVQSELELAEKQFSQFASEKGAIDIPAQGRAMLESAASLQGQLIFTESELEGLRQIYTDNNSRVRSLQARVNELRSALQKIGNGNANENSSAADIYPAIRQLPVLGVTYADLLRRTKVEEAVFATLTQQDELAKVEEAKEVPSVKLLDPPEAPQERSFPPKLSIMALLGTISGLVLSATWILFQSAWRAVHPEDPLKVLAVEVWSDVRRRLPAAPKNGAGAELDRGRNRNAE
jgi:uncharacterized protein involved in exopolysaccharide biosynthesis